MATWRMDYPGQTTDGQARWAAILRGYRHGCARGIIFSGLNMNRVVWGKNTQARGRGEGREQWAGQQTHVRNVDPGLHCLAPADCAEGSRAFTAEKSRSHEHISFTKTYTVPLPPCHREAGAQEAHLIEGQRLCTHGHAMMGLDLF